MADEQNDSSFLRTLILFIVLVPVIGYFLYVGYQKSTQADTKAAQCAMDCKASGHEGHSFFWSMFTGPKCECIGG